MRVVRSIAVFVAALLVLTLLSSFVGGIGKYELLLLVLLSAVAAVIADVRWCRRAPTVR